MVPLNIAYDYDMTLEDALWGQKNPIKEQVQAKAIQHVEKGYNVFIITKRCKDREAESNPVWNLAKKLGIPKDNCIFTCVKEKVKALHKHRIDLFLEDEEQSLLITRAATFAQVVSVYSIYNNGIEWDKAMDIKEKELLDFYDRTIHIASDHTGYEVKTKIRSVLETRFTDVVDYGCSSEEPCDYTVFGNKVAKAIQQTSQERKNDVGILFCSTGNGMTMTANRYKGIRAALCWEEDIARLARENNDANVLCIPAQHLTLKQIEDIIYIFLISTFESNKHKS